MAPNQFLLVRVAIASIALMSTVVMGDSVGVAQTVADQKAEADELLAICRHEVELELTEVPGMDFDIPGSSVPHVQTQNWLIPYHYKMSREKAFTPCEEARVIYQDLNEHNSEAQAMVLLARSYHQLARIIQPFYQVSQESEFYQTEIIELVKDAIIIYRELEEQVQAVDPLYTLVADIVLYHDSTHSYHLLEQQTKELTYQTLTLYNALNQSIKDANALYSIGIIYSDLGYYPKAIATFQQAIETSQLMNNPTEATASLLQLMHIHYRLEQPGQAIEALNHHVSWLREVEGPLATANRLRDCTGYSVPPNCYLISFDYPHDYSVRIREMLAYKAFDIYWELEAQGNQPEIFGHIAILARQLNWDTLYYWQQALEAINSVEDQNRQAEVLQIIIQSINHRSYEHQDQEWWSQLAQDSLTILQSLDDSKSKAEALHQLGLAYLEGTFYANPYHTYSQQEIERLDQSIALFNQTLPIFQKLGDHQGEADLLNDLGVAHIRLDQLEQAVDVFNRHIELIRDTQGQFAEAHSLRNLALSDVSGRHFNIRKMFAERALAIYETLDTQDWQIVTLRLLSNILYADGKNHELGFRYRLQALEFVRNIENRKLQVALLEVAAARSFPHTANLIWWGLEKDIELAQKELLIYRELGDRWKEANVLERIADNYIGNPEQFWIEEVNHFSVIDIRAPQFKQALETLQEVYNIYLELGDQNSQADILIKIGNLYLEHGHWDYLQSQLNSYLHGFSFYTEYRNPLFLKYTGILYPLGEEVYNCVSQEQYKQVLDFYKRAIIAYWDDIERTIIHSQKNVKLGKLAYNINQIAWRSSYYACQYEQSINFYQQAHSIYKQIGDERKLVDTLIGMGYQALAANRPQRALKFHNQVVELLQLSNNNSELLDLFSSLNREYRQLQYYDLAIKWGHNHLELSKTLNNSQGEISALLQLGDTYRDQVRANRESTSLHNITPNILISEFPLLPLDDLPLFNFEPLSDDNITGYRQVISLYQEALSILNRENIIINEYKESSILAKIGDVYDELELENDAYLHYRQALNLTERDRSKKQKILELSACGKRYIDKGKYQKSLNCFQESLAVLQSVGEGEINLALYPDSYRVFLLEHEGELLNWIGTTYYKLGEFEKSLEFKQQAYHQIVSTTYWYRFPKLTEEIVIISLKNNQPELAFEHYQHAIDFAQRKGNSYVTSNLYQSLGDIYLEYDNPELALQFHQPYLNLILDRVDKVNTLNQYAQKYQESGYLDQALVFYQQALAAGVDIEASEFGSFDAIGTSFSGIGTILAQQKQPELAITFYKSAINTYETIRANYTETNILTAADFSTVFLERHSDTYRALADLLLLQDRILEAQVVLDLLKVQELDDYLRGIRGNTITASGIEFLRPEQEILDQFNEQQKSAVELAKALQALQDIGVDNLTVEQQQRYDELRSLEKALNKQFSLFLDEPEIQALISQLNTASRGQALNLNNLRDLRNNLDELNAALLYPLILDDRIELVLSVPNAPPLRRVVDVSREDLNQTILNFRDALEYKREVEPLAYQLYQWLVEPIAADLANAEIDTIIYAPDGQLRYIPLAALYDGNHWLAEKYAINNITAASLTDLHIQPPTNPRVLAGAFADENQGYSVRIGPQDETFYGLPHAGAEVNILKNSMDNVTAFIDEQFSQKEIERRLGENDIVHLATHAAFVPGRPENSFILFGNGDRPTLADIQDWTLDNVDLVVLSACETGLGGFDDGTEILGMGYQFQLAGARASLSSLWQVSDQGTKELMVAFYSALWNGYSKSEALQRAQQALITGDMTVVEGERGARLNIIDSDTGEPLSRLGDLSHPYYWAPFILIGNGL